MSKIITARFEDICMKCCGPIKVGDLIRWEKKNSHHLKCDPLLGGLMKRGES
jgi:hypothetical protein